MQLTYLDKNWRNKMGSFNMTCFASQHTISTNNKAIIIPISQKATYNPVEISLGDLKISQYGFSHTSCYPDAFWGYAGPIIEGTYDDYGSFDLTDSEDNKRNIVTFFNILHEKLFKVEQGENSCHDLPIDFQSIYNPNTEYSFSELRSIWDCMWLVGQKNRLFIKEKNSARQLQFALLHQKAYKFFESYCKELTYNNKKIDEIFEDFIQSKQRFLLQPLKALENEGIEELKKESIIDVLDYGVSSLINFDNMNFGNSFHYWDLYDNKKELIEVIKDFYKKHPEDKKFNQITIAKIKKLCATSLKHRMIHIGMESFNIKLSPMTYGYQDYSNDVGKSFLKMIQKING